MRLENVFVSLWRACNLIKDAMEDSSTAKVIFNFPGQVARGWPVTSANGDGSYPVDSRRSLSQRRA
jgi:hypothetical protein